MSYPARAEGLGKYDMIMCGSRVSAAIHEKYYHPPQHLAVVLERAPLGHPRHWSANLYIYIYIYICGIATA